MISNLDTTDNDESSEPESMQQVENIPIFLDDDEIRGQYGASVTQSPEIIFIDTENYAQIDVDSEIAKKRKKINKNRKKENQGNLEIIIQTNENIQYI